MDLSTYLPILVDYSPVNISNSLTPEIYCKFNVKLSPSVFSTQGVNRYFSLFEEETHTQIPLVFMRLELDGTAIRFYTEFPLETNKTYTLNISATLPSKDNRQCDTGNSFSFKTISSFIYSPVLLSPGYDTIVTTPDFNWSIPTTSGTISGDLAYEVQVCSNERFVSNAEATFNFGPSAWVVSGNSLTLGLEDKHNYYWRVRGCIVSGSEYTYGDWSGIGSFYLGGDSYAETHDFTLMDTTDDTITFGAIDVPEVISFSGECNLNTWPDLSIKSPSGITMKLSRRSVDGYPDAYWKEVPGSQVELVGGYLYDPSQNLISNNIYKLEILSGSYVTHKMTFTSRFSPLYVSLEMIRTNLGNYISDMTDFDIYLNIFRVSQIANRHAYLYSPGLAPYASPLEDTIRNLTIPKTFGMGVWVESEVCARILRTKAQSLLLEFGRTQRLGDYQEDTDTGLLREINRSAAQYKREADIWLAEFSKKRIPLLAVSMSSSPSVMNQPRSYADYNITPRDWKS